MSKPRIFQHLGLLADPTRVRLLRMLEREELGVGELVRVLQLPQATVSRHLKALHDNGWIGRRQAGTANLVHLDPAELDEDASSLWSVMLASNPEPAQLEQDLLRLQSVLEARRVDSRAYFGRVAGAWDEVRRDLFGEHFEIPAMLSLLPGHYVVGDYGCGTGNAAAILAPLVRKVVAVDREQAMLDAARRRLEAVSNVDLRCGDLQALPVEDEELDAAVCMLVLHHVEDAAGAVSEMARTLELGHGRLVILDMMKHDREEYRRSMGHTHLGFSARDLQHCAAEADLSLLAYRPLAPHPDAKGPALFAATLERKK